ncbi:MAG: glutathione S-transferase [Candidatus Comchoanobacterales bacterium]
MSLPILYSFRRCPYAIRARMALNYAHIDVTIIEVNLKDKPQSLMDISPKGTVPVFVSTQGQVIEESLDIMLYALHLNDPESWLPQSAEQNNLINHLIRINDSEFKYHLDRFKYPNRYPNEIIVDHRGAILNHLNKLNEYLKHHTFLLSKNPCLADIAVFPFIRQAANVDLAWFQQLHMSHLKRWLDFWLSSELFETTMTKS